MLFTRLYRRSVKDAAESCGEDEDMVSALKLLRGAACAALAALTGGILYYNVSLPDNYLVTGGENLKLGEHIAVRSEKIIPFMCSARRMRRQCLGRWLPALSS